MMVVMRPRTISPRSLFALGVVGMLSLSACSGGGEPTAEAAETTTSTTTTEVTTTTAAPTTTTTTVPKSTTTRAPTTTTTLPTAEVTELIARATTTTVVDEATFYEAQETEPIAPPTDTYAAEPVISLGRIQIPKIGVDTTMYEGIRMTTLDVGPGHWPGSAMPGQAGNNVIGGHRTSKNRVFRDVDQLVAGDQIIFSDDNGTHVYAVNRVEVVQPTDVWIINPTPTPTATLFACHPPGSTAQRIVVFADLIS
ncbi:sortase A [Ilumatobacter fluminis]|uniref:Sortase A n=2 Tax=Ilumatobacter fluminis TaxID=467091 RepID=A0A4V3EJA9_9ACTN|nr:sortase A [Ilumatobacter fluminis]